MLKKFCSAFALFAISFNIAEAHTSHYVKQSIKHWKQNGVASYYGPGFWGHKTSSGKVMRPADMTVAHRFLPLGTRLKVINKDNGKTVTVTVNDRGPYVGHRIIDLAERPAKILDMKKTGLAHVAITAIKIPTHNILEVASYEPKKKKKTSHNFNRKKHTHV